ncbi:MAG: beta-ketoacyl-[acyl-carrier-protein] synthase II [Thiotrichales bacterium 32-46-8]|nr:MAG: beta-ketoacyl-[acyl-carrier-protein] synthase II [Thiotrichales bacterium 32-46-8]OZA97823.1 MAG: beta-ketoacyl-[acyl-carrier-protein] synthase II [Thiotrichales bacterium 34-46-19]OZB87060.1 MAG: beta-ketoacyl-[acyl-carrier-protein] synthase II [Thiotrichales bacterium 12-47-6]
MTGKRRVVVTGMGLVSPLGNDVQSSWSAALAGQSGVVPITAFDASLYSTRFGGTIKQLDPSSWISAKELKKMDPFIHYGLVAALQAWQDAGLSVTEANAPRIGVSMGSGIGGIGTIEQQHDVLLNSGPRRISPFFVPSSIINMISGHLSIMLGLQGPNMAVVTACATGTHAIGDAMRMIQYGDADVMLAGGAEYATTQLGLAGFSAARALSQRNDDPQAASRPWDKDRDGFVLSDGAACLVLEEYEHARARGAEIYAELAGFGMSSDAHHMTMPLSDGSGAARCMQNALRDAGVNAEQVGYINAHGTSTPLGDVAETMAIKRAFGDHAFKLMVSSTKSMTGHALGAAGAIESIFCLLSLRDQQVAPTINLHAPDEGCDLDYVPLEARDSKLDVVLNNSFGFGGTNATLVFRRLGQ